MNVSKFSILLVVTALLAVGATGCKRTPTRVTNITGSQGTGGVKNPNPEPIDKGPIIPEGRKGPTEQPLTPDPQGNTPQAGLPDFEGMLQDPSKFASETIYFEFDRSTIKKSEQVKAETVALFLKGDLSKKLLIEGHCDERGTEEYNRALGERRALAIREFLINSGIAADRIRTISYGEDKPADPGHDEAAWSKNRRGVFILLIPKN